VAVARVDIEVNSKGDVVIKKVANGLDDVDKSAKKAKSALDRTVESLNAHPWLTGAAAIAVLGKAALSAGEWLATATKAALEFGGRVNDMAERTGISAESLQKLGLAAKLTGSSMDDVAGAVNKMQKGLIDSPKAFQALGLSVEKLKAARPEDALAQIGAQITRLRTPAEQAAAAMAIFGKSGATFLPLLKSDIAGVGAEAEKLGQVMSGTTVAALDQIGDRADVLGATWDALVVRIGAVIATNQDFRSALEDLIKTLGNSATWIDKNSGELSKMITTLADAARGVRVLLNELASGAVPPWLLELGAMAGQGAQALLGSGVSQLAAWGRANRESQGGGPSAARGGGTRGYGSFSFSDGQWGPRKTPGFDPDGLQREKERQALAEAGHKKAMEAWKAGEEAAKRGAAAWEHAFLVAAQGTLRLAPSSGDIIGNVPLIPGGVPQSEMDAAVARQHALDRGESYENNLKAQQRAAEENRAVQVAMWLDIADKAGKVVDIFGNLNSLFDVLGVSADSSLRRITEGLGQVAGGVQQGATAFAQFASGDILGGISSAIGAVTSLVSGFRNIFGGGPSPAEILAQDLRNMQNEFINSMGGLDELSDRAARAGVSLDGMWNAKSVAEYEAAIHQVQRAIELTEEATRLTEEAMERWGVSVGEMGPAFAQQKIHESMVSILRDFELLKAGGADTAALLQGPMGEALNTLVQQSISAGVAMPEAMRPMLEQMATLGLLTDAAGNKITDVSTLNFTETLEASVSRMIDKIGELVDALLGIPPEVETQVKVNTQASSTGGSPPWPGGADGNPDTPYPLAKGDILMPRPGGHVRTLAEAGQAELAAPVKAFSRSLAQDLGRVVGAMSYRGPNGIESVVVEIDRRTIAEAHMASMRRNTGGARNQQERIARGRRA
jgi:hypothetical protein